MQVYTYVFVHVHTWFSSIFNHLSFTAPERETCDLDANHSEETPFRQKYLARTNETINDSVVQAVLFGLDGLDHSLSNIRHPNDTSIRYPLL